MAATSQSVRELYAAFSRGDLESVLQSLTEDVDWYAPGGAPYSGRRAGRGQVRQYFEEIERLVRLDEFDLDRVAVEGDTAVALGRERVTVRATGRHFETGWAHVFRFRHDRIAEVRLYSDTHAEASAFGESTRERAALTGPMGITHPPYSGETE